MNGMGRPTRMTAGGAPVTAAPAMYGAMTHPPRNIGAALFRQRLARGSGRITATQRKALPSTSFALPGQGTGNGKGPGSYPIPDVAHARNALARGAQHASPSQLAQIKRKVHAKFPGIKIGGKK